MNNKTFDILKWVAQILLPAAATLYFALAQIWGFLYVEQVVGTIVTLNTFLGVLLGISAAKYNKQDHSDGTLQIDSMNWDKDIYRLALKTGFDEIKVKNEIKLKVDTNANLSQEEHSL